MVVRVNYFVFFFQISTLYLIGLNARENLILLRVNPRIGDVSLVGYRGSYMSAHVLLNLLNELGKVIKCEACRAFYLFFATSLINSIIQEHEC